MTPQTAYNPKSGIPSPQANATAPSPYAYPPAGPGGAASTPTSTVPKSSSGPPAPQPGAAPMPEPSLPPRKANEKPLSPEQYAPARFTPAQPLPYPSQMSQPTVDHPLKGVPPGSTTLTGMGPAFNPATHRNSIASSPDMPVRATLEHPLGYVQNPFASDMTPDQRFTAEQQDENRSGTLPSLGYTDDPKGSRPRSEKDKSVWGTAKKWAKETSEQASKLGGEVWDKFGPDK